MNTFGAIEKALFEPMDVVRNGTDIEQRGFAMIIDHCPRFVQRFFGARTRDPSKP